MQINDIIQIVQGNLFTSREETDHFYKEELDQEIDFEETDQLVQPFNPNPSVKSSMK